MRAAIRRHFRARLPSAKESCAGARPLSRLRADGRMLLRRRPEKGLLGGMTEVPGSEWAHDFDAARALEAAPRFRSKPKWRRLPGVVKHVFTHFPLELTVFVAKVPRAAKAPKGARWAPLRGLQEEALPNRHAQGHCSCPGGACHVRLSKLDAEPALSRPLRDGARSAFQQIQAAAGKRRAAMDRLALGRRAGMVRRYALPDLERHSEQPHAALGRGDRQRRRLPPAFQQRATAIPATARAGW